MTIERQPLSSHARLTAGLLGLSICIASGPGHATNYPITPEQRETAQRVADAGVPISELAPGAPDSHTVKPGDTLWDISKLFLSSPWRWPELWGMNRDQVSNPHLIYPGQVLLLVKSNGRARLELARSMNSASAQAAGTTKLSPRVRSSRLEDNPITAIPQHLIEPFLTDAVVFDTDELALAPRIVATPEGRVLLTRGDLAYARGELIQGGEYRVFRKTTPLRDPVSKEILGYEAPYLGTADMLRPGREGPDANGKVEIVPATLSIRTARQEMGEGDRLSLVPPRNFERYVPHSPAQPVSGQVISIYGEALTAGQNQIVAINRGKQDGMERGHVLALWQAGRIARDKTGDKPQEIRLPDERHGLLFVFQVYQRVSYALIVSVKDPVAPGDRFTQP
ncbi:LysM domain-containing protein [Paucibacter sediminis]|uniref:LysM domain-containing protein n=1 Tax=Paucibacter sediminis TaxID=3019553 RepID=A0AA95SS44_9BURK|nr:LysM domain-containing protein [Paucibacter sp. S2-9]WIT14031.1 LysM domain-containing protein [Paucibacter sp. S2-9]